MGKIFIIVLTLLAAPLLGQHHGLWVGRNSLNSQKDLQQLNEIDQQLGLTDLYLQVRALGTNVYDQSNQNQILLDDIIEFCHQRQIKVHAWINVMYVWSKQNPPAASDHTFNLEADHLMTNADNDSPKLKLLRQKGVEGFFVDPGAFSNFNQIVSLSKSLIAELHFDGIHLDYLRYPGRGFIFSKYLRTQFMKRYYLDPIHLFKGFNQHISWQKLYGNFLLNELNNFVENLRIELNNINNKSMLSVAVKPDMERAKTEYYQDWLNWLQKGDCDYVLMMNYSPDDYEFIRNLDNAARTKLKDKIVCGIGAYYLDQKQLEQRMVLVQKSGLKGYALFSFTTLKEQPEILSLVNIKN